LSGEGRTHGLAQRLSDLGRTKRFRIAVAALFSLIVLATSVFFYAEAARLDGLLARIPEILQKADLKANDPVAKQLVEKGTLTIDGREVGDPALAKFMERLFEGTGRIDGIGEATVRLIDTERREWMPIAIAQEPWIALAGGLLGLAIVLFACWTDLALQLVAVSLAATLLGGGALVAGRPSMAASLAAIPLFLFMFSLVVRVLLEALDRPRELDHRRVALLRGEGVVRNRLRRGGALVPLPDTGAVVAGDDVDRVDGAVASRDDQSLPASGVAVAHGLGRVDRGEVLAADRNRGLGATDERRGGKRCSSHSLLLPLIAGRTPRPGGTRRSDRLRCSPQS